MARFTRRQWITFLTVSIVDFCSSICASLQAPFYPQEAEKKGCTASEYGLVFGIFQLVVFLVSPIYGRYLNKVGLKLVFNGGIYLTAICAILFGFLDKVPGHYPFIILSFIVRIAEAFGMAGFMTAVFSIYAKEFPNNVATILSSLEMFWGLGLIAGPSVGGALYELGGYTLPFLVMGSSLLFAAVFTQCVLPPHDEVTQLEKGPSALDLLKIPGIFLSNASVFATSVSIGFLQATLEPHLRQFGLSPVMLGVIFVVNGGLYALTAPMLGVICDRISQPKLITLMGTFLIATAFALIGPAPFIPLEPTLGLCVSGLVLHGLGLSAQLVPSFSDALKISIARGLPNNLTTFGVISGLWTSCFALGAFIGPTISGVLFDLVGFRNSVMCVVVTHLALGLMVIVYLFVNKPPTAYIGLNGNNQEETNTEKSEPIFAKTIRVPLSRVPTMNNLVPGGSYKRSFPFLQSDKEYSKGYGSLNI